MGRAMRKRAYGHMRVAKAQISMRIRADSLGPDWPLKESLATTECMNGEQWLRLYLAYAVYDLNLRISRIFEGTFSLDEAQIFNDSTNGTRKLLKPERTIRVC